MAAAIALCISAARDSVNAQGTEGPLTQQQFNDYEQMPSGGLTADDLRYLTDNQIRVPDELSPVQKIGLHGVINDPKTRNNPATRMAQVNYYLNLAVEQTLRCAINPRGTNCDRVYQ